MSYLQACSPTELALGAVDLQGRACFRRTSEQADLVPRYTADQRANQVAAALGPVALGWLLVYALVYLMRWIRAGFTPRPKLGFSFQFLHLGSISAYASFGYQQSKRGESPGHLTITCSIHLKFSTPT